VPSFFDSIAQFLNSGIAGSEITPLRLLVVLVLMSALFWSTRRLTHWFVDHVLARRGVDVSLREALGAILRYGLIAIGALVILQGAGIDLTSLNVLIGAIGVGLGFGLQAVTSNFFSGLIILFERPIKVGHRIEIGGAVGQVREIAARATTLVTDENVAIIVPNSQFISEPVTNYSRPDVRGEPQPEVEFVEMGLASLRFKLQVWSSAHPNTAGKLRSDLNFEVWRRLKAQGVAPAAGVVAVTVAGPAP
jgi:small-conductance mechanosensitive channel